MFTPRTRVKLNSTWSPKSSATVPSSETLMNAGMVICEPTTKWLLWLSNFCFSSALFETLRHLLQQHERKNMYARCEPSKPPTLDTKLQSCNHPPVGRSVVHVLRLLHQRLHSAQQQLGEGCEVLEKLGAAQLQRTEVRKKTRPWGEQVRRGGIMQRASVTLL
jgi:hypothetical protein